MKAIKTVLGFLMIGYLLRFASDGFFAYQQMFREFFWFAVAYIVIDNVADWIKDDK
jgi:hypothetical protein